MGEGWWGEQTCPPPPYKSLYNSVTLWSYFFGSFQQIVIKIGIFENEECSERNLCNCVNKPEKNSVLQRGLNPWPRDTGAMLFQLSYEATDVGSRYLWVHMFPWKKWVLVIYEINHIFADFNAFLSAMLTIDGFSLTGSSQKLKNPWKSMLSRNC